MIFKNQVQLIVIFLLIFACRPSTLFAGEKLFQAESEIMDGLGLAYALKFKKAEDIFNRLEDSYPGSPAASFYPAAIKWSRAELYNRWSRVAKLYSSTPPPKHDFLESKILLKKMDETIRRADAILDKKPTDFEALFYRAGAYGFIARIEFLRGYYIPAILNGRKSAKGFESLLALYPDTGDAMLAPGIYRYFIGKLSTPMRSIVALAGLRGSKKEGIALIRQAYKTGVVSRVDSADFLALIYWRWEKDTDESQKWIERLEKIAPLSHLSTFHRLMLAHSINNIKGEEDATKELLTMSIERKEPSLKEWEPLMLFTLASIKEKQGLKKQARGLYNEALESNSLNHWLKGEITLKLKSLKKEHRGLM